MLSRFTFILALLAAGCVNGTPDVEGASRALEIGEYTGNWGGEVSYEAGWAQRTLGHYSWLDLHDDGESITGLYLTAEGEPFVIDSVRLNPQGTGFRFMASREGQRVGVECTDAVSLSCTGDVQSGAQTSGFTTELRAIPVPIDPLPGNLGHCGRGSVPCGMGPDGAPGCCPSGFRCGDSHCYWENDIGALDPLGE